MRSEVHGSKIGDEGIARVILLRTHIPTRLTEHGQQNSIQTLCGASSQHMNGFYYRSPYSLDGENDVLSYETYPVVVNRNGVPWVEANMFLHSRMDIGFLKISTTIEIAKDLSAYLNYIETTDIDFRIFPTFKLAKPTYKYAAYLRGLLTANELSTSLAKRRMRTVVRFYRWLISEKIVTLGSKPWLDITSYVTRTDGHGFQVSKKILTTDLAIKSSQANDPYADFIVDDGNLRPLAITEQEWLMEALAVTENTEMILIHLYALLTGARIQTILTTRVKNISKILSNSTTTMLRLPIGNGTRIDTKNGKNQILVMPRNFAAQLETYGNSDRAKNRRILGNFDQDENPPMFLSLKGAMMYAPQSRSDAITKRVREKAYEVNGQAVRQYIRERIIPYIRERHDRSFKYKFHDLRATCGMNLTERKMTEVAESKLTLHQAREYVRDRLGHSSTSVTDRYLKFRERKDCFRNLQADYEDRLQHLALSAGFERRAD